MKKRFILITIFCLVLISLVGCSNNNDYKAVFEGETENWEAEVRCLEDSNFEDMTQYYFTLRYKKDLSELTSLNKISVGYLWLSKDAELVPNESYDDILDYSYDDMKDSVVYVESNEEPKRIFDFFKSEMPVWEEAADNKEFSVAFIMPNEVFDTMTSEIEFMVEWGNNRESFKLFRVD